MAIFLTSVNILDTGFLDVNTRTNQLSAANRVNSGSALQLKGALLELGASASLEKGVTPGYTPSSIKNHEKRALVSINPTTFTLTLNFNSDNVDTANAFSLNDMAILASVFQLPHTKGFKALYYPVDNAASGDTRKLTSQVTYQLGATDTTESQGDIDITLWTGATTASSKDLTDVNYIPVRFENVSISQTPDNKVKVTLSGVITG